MTGTITTTEDMTTSYDFRGKPTGPRRTSRMETSAPSIEVSGENPSRRADAQPEHNTMPEYLSITETADLCGVAPGLVSSLFYRRRLDKSRCVRVAGRTLLPREYVENVVRPLLIAMGYMVTVGK